MTSKHQDGRYVFMHVCSAKTKTDIMIILPHRRVTYGGRVVDVGYMTWIHFWQFFCKKKFNSKFNYPTFSQMWGMSQH